MTEINAAAGRRVAIIRRAFSSVPMDYRFSARVASPGQVLGGSVEIRNRTSGYRGRRRNGCGIQGMMRCKK